MSLSPIVGVVRVINFDYPPHRATESPQPTAALHPPAQQSLTFRYAMHWRSRATSRSSSSSILSSSSSNSEASDLQTQGRRAVSVITHRSSSHLRQYLHTRHRTHSGHAVWYGYSCQLGTGTGMRTPSPFMMDKYIVYVPHNCATIPYQRKVTAYNDYDGNFIKYEPTQRELPESLPHQRQPRLHCPMIRSVSLPPPARASLPLVFFLTTLISFCRNSL